MSASASAAGPSATRSVGGARMPGSRTSFGRQRLSTSASEPACTFAISTREVQQRRYEGPEVATVGAESPGPNIYTLPASVGGKQPDGRKRDPPVWRFGTDTRFRPASAPNEPAPNAYLIRPTVGQKNALSRMASEPRVGFGTANREHMSRVNLTKQQAKALHGAASPGPAAISASGPLAVNAIGKQINSKFSTTPKYSLASRARAPDAAGLSPGPLYAVPAAFGSQPESLRSREPTPKIGTSTRDGMTRVFISREHGKGSHGRDTPGPAADYHIRGSIGRQVSSKQATRPSSAFGRSSRWAADERERRQNCGPGPGAYDD